MVVWSSVLLESYHPCPHNPGIPYLNRVPCRRLCRTGHTDFPSPPQSARYRNLLRTRTSPRRTHQRTDRLTRDSPPRIQIYLIRFLLQTYHCVVYKFTRIIQCMMYTVELHIPHRVRYYERSSACRIIIYYNYFTIISTNFTAVDTQQQFRYSLCIMCR